MSVVVLGANGLLGEDLVSYFYDKGEVVYAFLREPRDYMHPNIRDVVVSDTKKIIEIFKNEPIKYVINAAAFTDVDGAENPENFDKALDANTLLTVRILTLLRQTKSKAVFFQVSTDYITEPNGFYGYSKLLAESFVKLQSQPSIIGRLTVLYGEQKGFVKWVYQQLKQNKKINVVVDQISCPTYSKEAAELIGSILENYDSQSFLPGFVPEQDICGKESMSRYEMACRIAHFYKLDVNLITPLRTLDLQQKAPRPMGNKLKADVQGFKYRTFEQCLSDINTERLNEN